MNDSSNRIYGFGKFRVDARERLLFDGEAAVSLTPKAFELLLLLVENAGHALSKDEIMETVWRDSFVEENNLAQNISLLRKVLGDGIGGAKFIETVSKHGYRFIAPVQIVVNEKTDSITVERTRARFTIEDEIETEDFPRSANLQTFSPQPILIRSKPSLELPVHIPETHYVQNGDVNIAYQTIGSGDLDIVFVMGWVSHLEYFWKEPHFAAFLNRLASFSRLILFDKRGTGLSDRVPITELPTLEQRMDDVRCVMEAVDSKRAALVGVSEGGPMCSLFAATYPEKTAALVMIGSYAKRIWEEDYPWGVSKEDREKFFELMQRDWGKPVGIEERAPSLANDEDFRDWWATYLRMGASPGAAVALTKMNAEIDVRQVLPTIRVPSLVIHRSGDMCLKVEEGRFVASKIPACKYVELGGIDHLPFVGNQDEILDEIEEFLTGVRHAEEIDRVLATVMNVKIVNSRIEAEERGAEDWNDLFERSRIYVQRQLKLFKGKQISYDETGVLATFDGPAKAIRCATAITDSARRLNIKVKTGLHTGECDVVGEKYSGFAVELARKIAEESSSGEILVSRTVKDLVAGSGIVFEDYKIKSFEDAQGEWRLFFVKK
jgi:pimeloyl-ACP methyl ester carboxylesterase/DNA-binding winged helix-turn-helix (wHTH) protein/class 3 adenylate cyclase